MEILWHGLSFVEVKGKTDGQPVVIAINPFDESVGLKPSRVKANIVILSSTPSPAEKKKIAKSIGADGPFFVEEAGEYEKQGVKMRGLDNFYRQKESGKLVKNIIFKTELEKIKICALGNFKGDSIPPDILESILGIDILLIPIGGGATISSKEAVKIISQIEPKIVIPVNYLPSSIKSSSESKGLKINLEDEKNFLKNFGAKDKEKIEKLKIKTDELQREGTELVLMEMT